jgi:hypothetical protein
MSHSFGCGLEKENMGIEDCVYLDETEAKRKRVGASQKSFLLCGDLGDALLAVCYHFGCFSRL